MDRAEQVRQILTTRGLTLYRVSQQSAELFGRSSRFYIPHNLYHDGTDPSSIPTLHQILALSHITDYRLYDWLAVFGVDLGQIPRLQLMIPRKRTALLDSSVYDPLAWVPWFVDRPQAGPSPSIAPLGQLLAAAAPRRAADLLPGNKGRFLYGKVGEEDAHALPHLAAGSIVRVDARRPEKQLSGAKSNPERPLFLVEHTSGWTCSQLVLLANDTIMLHSPHRPCAQIELRLGKDARVLGTVDAELRLVTSHRCAGESSRLVPARKLGLLPAPGPPTNLRDLLRNSRIRAGLSFREASTLTRRIAKWLSNEHYFAAASTLSDYETLLEPPRHIQKAITLCILYSIDFGQFLRTSGLPIGQAGSEPIPDELLPRKLPAQSRSSLSASDDQKLPEQSGFLGPLLKQWEEVPLFLGCSLNEFTGLKNFSLSDVFWVGGDKEPIHPWLVDATFVAVNRRIKKPAGSTAKTGCEQPLYVIFKRDGGYLCGCCILHEGKLLVRAHPGSSFSTWEFRNGVDAEVIGQVTAILRRLI